MATSEHVNFQSKTIALLIGLSLFPILCACRADSGLTVAPGGNRLLHEKSAYLLEHSRDPVDWYPWGEEAFAKAKTENKPVFLSIGYSACHWCHVMHRESFENKDIAKILNNGFICIKVDRENRPDLDEIYMKATEAISGTGGWPMTLLLTADKKPFFAGTYFPPKALRSMLLRAQELWHNDRAKIDTSSDQIVTLIRSNHPGTTSSVGLDRSLILAALRSAYAHRDPIYGGIGQQPKFPMPGLLNLLMRMSDPGSPLNPALRNQAKKLFTTTLDCMADGGIHDHVGGGFCRYSVDRQWHVPHFEKMLYDNALLANAYLDGYLIAKNRRWLNTAKDTLDFTLRDMKSPQGAFYSSLDADSEGKEGAYYVFTRKEIEGALGPENAEWFVSIFKVSVQGNLDNGQNVLYLVQPAEILAAKEHVSVDALDSRIRSLLPKLFVLRQQRVPPHRDEKIITSWNALMISSLVQGYKVLHDNNYLVAAKKCARYLLSKATQDGKLQHNCTNGEPFNYAYLDDYSYFVQALLDLASVDTDKLWLRRATKFTEVMSTHFYDSVNGGFYYTADNQTLTLTRPRMLLDAVTPSPSAIAILNLIKLSSLSDRPSYMEMASQSLHSQVFYIEREPLSSAYMLATLDSYLTPPATLRLVMDSSTKSAQMKAAVFNWYLPRVVVLMQNEFTVPNTRIGTKDSDREKDNGRSAVLPGAYLCTGQVCNKPILEVTELRQRLCKLRLGAAF